MKTKKQRLTLQRVGNILNEMGYGHHDLRYKPISEWDNYDIARWNRVVHNTIFRKWKKKRM